MVGFGKALIFVCVNVVTQSILIFFIMLQVFLLRLHGFSTSNPIYSFMTTLLVLVIIICVIVAMQ